MEIHYFCIYRLPGVIGLPAEADIELLRFGSDNARAFITVTNEIYNQHFRRMAAFGIMTAETFGFATAPTLCSTQKERFERAIARVNITGLEREQALLVVEVVDHEEKLELVHIIDAGDFGGGLQLFDTEVLALKAEKALRAAFAGISLVLPEHTTDTLQLMGSIAYAIEPKSNRIIYNTSINTRLSVTTKVNLEAAEVSLAATISQQLRASAELESIARLLSLSSMQSDDKLTSFLSAWTGLELFVQNVFKSTYEPQLYKLFESSAPSSARIFVGRVQAVMKDKYNIRDKFVTIASVLNEPGADADIEIFKKIKEKRDDLAHAMKADAATLPSNDTRALLRKYLRLHLER